MFGSGRDYESRIQNQSQAWKEIRRIFFVCRTSLVTIHNDMMAPLYGVEKT